MINTKGRQTMARIARGESAPLGVASKTAMYGLFAKCLSNTELEGNLPRNIGSFGDLELAVAEYISRAAIRGYCNLGKDDQDELKARLELRAAQFPRSGMSSDVLERLTSGAKTGAQFEVATLRSTAFNIHFGWKLSEAELAGSKRVPARSAMLYIYDLAKSMKDDMWPYPSSTGGDDDLMYAPHVVKMVKDKGLGFAVDPLERWDDTEGHTDLHLGCPATVVAGYMATVHELGAKAALDAKLITLAA